MEYSGIIWLIVIAFFMVNSLLSFILGAKLARNEPVLSVKPQPIEIIDPTEDGGVPENDLYNEDGTIKDIYHRDDEQWLRQEGE